MQVSTDLSGQVFGKLTVIKKNDLKPYHWDCLCECGNVRVCSKGHLTSGHTSSCGCSRRKVRIDLTGQRFSRLLVVKQEENRGGKIHYLCICDCGKSLIVSMDCLRRKTTKSCGCLQVDIMRGLMTTHGHTRQKDNSGAYRSWASMRLRVLVPASTSYKNYGAKGIRICQEWESFENFYIDMGDRPKGHSLDRIDSSGNYEKANCRWADRVTQANNRRNVIKIEMNGVEKTISQWSKDLGISHRLIYKRIKIMGWAAERALTTL